MSNGPTPMNINSGNRLIPPSLTTPILGKRKNGRTTYESISKRTDLSMVSEISRITNDTINIRLPKNIVNELKRINRNSSTQRIEYAGKIDFSSSRNGSNSVKFNNPLRLTTYQRGHIGSEVIDLIKNTYVTYHTHPAPPPMPRNNVNRMNINNNSRTRYVTLPSGLDFEAYIKGYPNMQANIIADAHGYYIIDIIESGKKRVRPNPVAVNRFMEWLRDRPFLKSRVRSFDGYEYFETTLKEWKYAINQELLPYLVKHFGISIRYHGYTDIPGLITIGRS